MKSERLRKAHAAQPAPEVRALLDALPFPAMLSAAGGSVLHANAAMREAAQAGTRETARLALAGLGECTLTVLRPADAQTQRLAALGFMLAGVCHEVSNPLAAVHSMLQILQSKRGVNAETLDKGLASIGANIARVLAITRKLGDFSRVGGEAPARLAIDAAMEAASALLRHSDQAPGVTLAYAGASAATVLARAGQLEQVFFNILLNAAQAMGGEGRIDAQVRLEAAAAVITIRDSGPGIAPENLARVFDPFFTTKPAGEGVGLGLAISNEIARELGGEMRASNHPQGGACFEITLPLAAP
jgi:C4-dicarboxylate-specific signal transduction histidine kinase